MKVLFLGTRGLIDRKKRRHRRHSALLVSIGGTTLLIDCGADWLGRIASLGADAILLTHAHPDHAYGLSRGAPCPVYATRETWRLLRSYPISEPRVVIPRALEEIGPMRCEAFAVEHSLLAPAVGYRITGGGRSFFYVPDVVAIRERKEALHGIDLFIGDGATITRPILRSRGGALIGHAPITAQLRWCREEGVRAAIFTHCGSQIVAGDERVLGPLVRRLGRECQVAARIAYDGLSVDLGSTSLCPGLA
jgi:phosphoribosyl 1,2-cyclic phosphodiesterase